MSTILVTGASGRTGRRVISQLLARNQRLRAFVETADPVLGGQAGRLDAAACRALLSRIDRGTGAQAALYQSET